MCGWSADRPSALALGAVCRECPLSSRAHSVNVCRRRHRLSAHSRATADLARAFAAPFGAGGLAAALGLLHDAGKASTAWQRRLLMVEAARGKVGVPHKELGARLASSMAGPGGMAILGHHGGLGDRAEFLDVVGRAVEFETRDRLVVEIPETSALIDAAEPAHSPRPSQSTRTATHHRPLTEHMTAPAHLRDQRRLMAP